MNYAAITVFSSVGSNVFNFICVRKYCYIHLIFHFDWKKHIIPIFILFAANIANMIYINSDITLLGLMKSNYIVGIYSVSSRTYQIVKTLISAILIVTVPRLAILFGNHRMREYRKILVNLTNTLMILVLPASVGLFMLAREVILIISGPHFLRATTSLQILCFAYIFSILSWILSDCVWIPAKKEKRVLVSMTASVVLNVIFNLIFIPWWNEYAAAMSTVLAEMCMFISNYFYSKDLVHDIFVSKEFWWNFFSSLIGCIRIIIICLLCDFGWQSLVGKTISSILLSLIMYLAILVVMKNRVIFDALKK